MVRHPHQTSVSVMGGKQGMLSYAVARWLKDMDRTKLAAYSPGNFGDYPNDKPVIRTGNGGN